MFKYVSKITEIALWIAAASFGVVVVAIPWFGPATLIPYFKQWAATYIFMYIGGGAGMLLLVELLRIIHTVNAGNPFVKRNVSSLRRIALACLIAFLDIAFISFYRISLTLLICAALLFLGMLCAMTFAQVFGKAVFYKQENDLTI